MSKSFVPDRKAFFANIKTDVFGGRMSQKQVEGINLVLDAWDRYAPSTATFEGLAYVFATDYHETAATMEPVRETLATSAAQAMARLDSAWKRGRMPWVKRRYWAIDRNGQSPHGRGLVQLTHPENYEKADSKLGLGGKLIKNYDLAMRPDIAAKITVLGMLEGWFTGKKLSDYCRAGRPDFRGARRIINGTDKAALIAGYAQEFLEAIMVSQTPQNSCS